MWIELYNKFIHVPTCMCTCMVKRDTYGRTLRVHVCIPQLVLQGGTGQRGGLQYSDHARQEEQTALRGCPDWHCSVGQLQLEEEDGAMQGEPARCKSVHVHQ